MQRSRRVFFPIWAVVMLESVEDDQGKWCLTAKKQGKIHRGEDGKLTNDLLKDVDTHVLPGSQ